MICLVVSVCSLPLAADAPSTAALVAAHLSLRAQVQNLAATEGRLERMAAAAEAGQSTNGVATLAAQQLRSIEVGGRHKGRNIIERLPKHLHASVRRTLRRAWELDDAVPAERLIRNLARRLEQMAPGLPCQRR